ncbi:hypothetical protein RCL1_007465 [Eukaryota sp. TZLM3-RCL]
MNIFSYLVFVSCIIVVHCYSCNETPFSDVDCTYTTGLLENCILGESYLATCSVNDTVECEGPREFSRPYTCQPCFFTDPLDCSCSLFNTSTLCISTDLTPVQYTCTVDPTVICIGGDDVSRRSFTTFLPCRRAFIYSKSTIRWLSVFLGGFGVDRIYLGYTTSGIIKAVTLGGLGVWSLVDTLLIWFGYLGPVDGTVLM